MGFNSAVKASLAEDAALADKASHAAVAPYHSALSPPQPRQSHFLRDSFDERNELSFPSQPAQRLVATVSITAL